MIIALERFGMSAVGEDGRLEVWRDGSLALAPHYARAGSSFEVNLGSERVLTDRFGRLDFLWTERDSMWSSSTALSFQQLRLWFTWLRGNVIVDKKSFTIAMRSGTVTNLGPMLDGQLPRDTCPCGCGMATPSCLYVPPMKRPEPKLV